MRDDNYRWGDDPADLRALDAWITRGPENDEPEGDPDDCLDGAPVEPDTRPCGVCPACQKRADDAADEAALAADGASR